MIAELTEPIEYQYLELVWVPAGKAAVSHVYWVTEYEDELTNWKARQRPTDKYTLRTPKTRTRGCWGLVRRKMENEWGEIAP